MCKRRLVRHTVPRLRKIVVVWLFDFAAQRPECAEYRQKKTWLEDGSRCKADVLISFVYFFNRVNLAK